MDGASADTRDGIARVGVFPSVVLGVGLWLLYQANLDVYRTGDTEGAVLLPVAILRGDGPFLDRFERLLIDEDGHLPLHVARRGGHLVSLYPLAPALLALPLETPQVWLLDRFRPGWENGPKARLYLEFMAKHAASAIVAAAVVTLLHLLVSLGIAKPAAWAASIAAGLGSTLWPVASQAPWQHGPATLALLVAILLVTTGTFSRGRALFAGLAIGALVAFRLQDVVFAAALLGWCAWTCPRRLPFLAIGPAISISLLIAWNTWLFGSWQGGQSILEAAHPELHGTAGAWSGSLMEGALGTLLSPSRGLFVYVPWAAFALAFAPVAVRRWPRDSALTWLLVSLVPFSLMLSKYSVWWAGHCFGPRYWTDALPLLAILLGSGIDAASRRFRPAIAPLAIAIALSVAVAAIGAACYPSSWCDHPGDIDRDHARLWDWQDTELSRCLAEGIRPRMRKCLTRAEHLFVSTIRGDSASSSTTDAVKIRQGEDSRPTNPRRTSLTTLP